MARKRRFPKAVLIFDVNAPRWLIQLFEEDFAEENIVLIFPNSINEIDPGRKKPARMSDPRLLKYAERVLQRRYSMCWWEKGVRAFLITCDKGFISRIEIEKINQPLKTPETKELFVIEIGRRLEKTSPGITRRLSGRAEVLREKIAAGPPRRQQNA